MRFYNKDSSNYNYFKIYLAVLAGIVSSIIVYFAISKARYIGLFISKLTMILTPIIIGIIFAYLLNPIVKKLEKLFKKSKKITTKLARAISIFITYISFSLILILIIRFLIPSLFESINLMLKNIPIYLENLFDFARRLCNRYNIDPNFLNDYSENINKFIKKSFTFNLSFINNLATGITSILRLLIDIIIGIIISVYLIYDKESFVIGSKKLLKAVFPTKIYKDIISYINYIYDVFSGFMIAKLIDSIIIGILTFIILSIFKIPYPLVISLVVGVTNIIPYFGPFIGAVPAFILLLVINPTKALLFAILILIIQQFDGNILGPKLIGGKTGIKSFWVLFSILLFGGLFGFVGMILAVPLFACIYEFIKNKVDRKLKEKELESKKI